MRTSLSSASIFISALCAAQLPYRSLPTADSEWVERHSWTQGWDATICDRVISSGPDTLIGTVLYHRLMTQGNCTQSSLLFGTWSFFEPTTDLWYFREDSAARQVFAYDPDTQSEVILLDFSIFAGAYPLTYLSSNDQFAISGMDSIMLSDGWHRRFDLSFYSGAIQLYLIEGVGALAGFHIGAGGVGPLPWSSNELLCHSANGLVIYYSGAGCNLSTSVPNVFSNSSALRLQPNPATNEFTIVGMNGSGTQSFTVHDALGHLHCRGRLHGDRIVCGTWPQGAYYITLYDDKKATRSGRIMKL